MSLPTITNINPVVVESVAQRNFSAMYNTLLVSRYLDGKQALRLGFKPYDATAQVVTDDGKSWWKFPTCSPKSHQPCVGKS